MKLSTSLTAAIAALAPTVSALAKGFNIAAEKPDGTCKTQADWLHSFQVMKGLPGNFKDVRVYAASDCNTLARAVPAAIQANVKILVGVWTQDDAHYTREKNALKRAIRQHGVKWISAVSVGSEDLYRKEVPASSIATKIYDVRGMISQKEFGGANIPVGHVDTWTAWVDGANADVIKAVDFVGMDAYPYFQDVSIAKANATLHKAITDTKAAIKKYNPGTPMWLTESGWPVAGPNAGAAIVGKANARKFWKQALCSVFPKYNTFVYTLRDYQTAPANPSFGVVGKDFAPLYDLSC